MSTDISNPHSREAEAAVLGAILLNNELIEQARSLLKLEDFYVHAHREVWRAILRLADRDSVIDLITLDNELKRTNQLERCGGAVALGALIDGVPQTDDVSYYAKIIRHHALTRRLIALAQQLESEARDSESATDIIARAEAALSNWKNSIEESLTRPIFPAAERKEHIKPAYAVVRGVAYRGQVSILEGQAGAGKSSVLADLAATVSQELQVLLITNEAPEEFDARFDAWTAFHDRELCGLFMLTEPAGLFDNERTAALIATARRLGGFDLVVIDVLSNEFADAGRDETNESMAVAFRAAVTIARALNAAVVISTHIGWSGEHTRGGSQSWGSARRVLKVENVDDVITLKVVKANVARDLEQRRFRIVQVESNKLPDADPRRLEEYTVLLPAERVVHETVTTRQREVLTALNEPAFAQGARFAELQLYTRMPKSSLSMVVNVLIKRGLVHKGKSGVLTLTDEGADLARAPQNRPEKATELALNYTSQNWHVEAQNSSTISALVHTSSLLVQSSSVDSVHSVRSLSPLLESERSELIEQEQAPMGDTERSKVGEQRAESPGSGQGDWPGPMREGNYDMNAEEWYPMSVS